MAERSYHTSADQGISVAAVFAGRQAHDFFEELVEIGGVVEAAFVGNADDVELCSVVQKHGTGFVDSPGIDVIKRGKAANLLEERAKIVGR